MAIKCSRCNTINDESMTICGNCKAVLLKIGENEEKSSSPVSRIWEVSSETHAQEPKQENNQNSKGGTAKVLLKMMFDDEYGQRKTDEWFAEKFPAKPYEELSDEEKKKRQTLAISAALFVLFFFIILFWLL